MRIRSWCVVALLSGGRMFRAVTNILSASPSAKQGDQHESQKY